MVARNNNIYVGSAFSMVLIVVVTLFVLAIVRLGRGVMGRSDRDHGEARDRDAPDEVADG